MNEERNFAVETTKKKEKRGNAKTCVMSIWLKRSVKRLTLYTTLSCICHSDVTLA